jgi:uncharacterized membrane protein (UPF0136 family)
VRDVRFIAARGGFVLLFLGLTLLQLFSFPGQFQHMRRTQGLSLVFEVSLTLIVGLWLLCGQLALFALLKIVGEMKVDAFYSLNNLVWIERLLLTFKTATVIPIVLFLMIAPQADDPGFLVVLSIATLFIFSLTAITSLLKDQIEMKTRN